MTEFRVWHASRDAYHCAFRLLRLLRASPNSIELERLRILDMFLLFPVLLHRTSLTKTLRDKFRQLQLEKPESQFLRFPSNSTVFQEIRIYQNSALSQLIARDIIAPESMKKGKPMLNGDAVPSALSNRIDDRNNAESELMEFLLGSFSSLPLRGRESLYRRAALPTRVIPE